MPNTGPCGMNRRAPRQCQENLQELRITSALILSMKYSLLQAKDRHSLPDQTGNQRTILKIELCNSKNCQTVGKVKLEPTSLSQIFLFFIIRCAKEKYLHTENAGFFALSGLTTYLICSQRGIISFFDELPTMKTVLVGIKG